ncbi:interferon-induced protein 44-like [Ruditapes philippinarum]|uniref:interferon-induced protein 44-like n=1 Tax=Ruditapes philippinarum TaxID=129788 RepID=UPI00295BFE96|nr:interferon-induced protein 44-like [Ruditapes philippinarum]
MFSYKLQYSKKLRDQVGKLVKKAPAPTLLLVGPSGHGKSAFINSVSTISQDRKSNITNCAKSANHVTPAFRKYYLQGELKGFKIADTMGVTQDTSQYVNKIVKIMNGHIKPGTKFTNEGFQTDNRENEFTDSYINAPEESDKVHCVIILLDMTTFANKSELIKIAFKDSIQNLLTELNDLDVPRIVILTHADKMDKNVDENIANIFYSEKIKGIVNIVNDMFGVPKENIHPIVNYAETKNAHLDYRLHIPILLALESALIFADETLHKRRLHE